MTTEAMAPPKTKSQVLRSFDVADFPRLNGLEEEWRFTPLKRLGDLVTATALTGTAPAVEHGDLPAGVSITDVDAVEPMLTPFDRISALAFGSAAGVTLIEVAPETVPADPAGSVRSAATNCACPPVSVIASTTAMPRPALRPCTSTSAPSAPSRMAMALPMPEVAPVTRARVPLRSMRSSFSSRLGRTRCLGGPGTSSSGCARRLRCPGRGSRRDRAVARRRPRSRH
jgi:hypothetical protein